MRNLIKRVLVVGCNGYIGNHLYSYLEKEYSSLEIIGKSRNELDLLRGKDAVSLAGLLDMDTAVIVCSGIKKQHGDTLETFLKNVTIVTNLCRVIRENPVRHLIYFSSAEVYGEATHNTNITEETQVAPGSYYGIAKYACEVLLRKEFEKQSENSLTILRTTLVYGPREQGTFYGPSGFIRTALQGKSITLWGEGDELREFVFIDDLVKITASLIFHEYDGVVNVVNGRSRSFKESLEIINEISSPPIQVKTRPRSKEKVDQTYINNRLIKILPDACFTSLEDGIRQIYEDEMRQQHKQR